MRVVIKRFIFYNFLVKVVSVYNFVFLQILIKMEEPHSDSQRHLKRYANENRLRTQMIKTSTIKNLRRRNLEILIEKQLVYMEQQKRQQLKNQQMTSAMLALKTITFGIILRIAGAMFQSILSLSACVVYVVSTYYDGNPNTAELFSLFEIVFASLFSVDYLISCYNAKNKRKFFFQASNIVDLLTILPVFVQYVPGGQSSAGDFLRKFIGVVRVLRVFRVLRMYRLFNSQGTGDRAPDTVVGESSEVRRKIIIISATILAIVFISTGIIYSFNYLGIGFEMSLPDENEQLTFDSAFYFMIITVCTVGYGDIHAGSDLARVVIALFIIIIIVLVSKQTSELNELMKFSSLYQAPYPGPEKSHIILIGNITSNSLSKFLKEFYHTDHNMKEDMRVVIIQDHDPSRELLTVLQNPKYEESLHYIKGNIFQQRTMKLAKLEANKIFILCNQYSADSNKDDTFALLATKSIHEYDHSSKIFVQLVDPEFLLHSWADWDVVMSTQAYKMGIIASNVFNPGFSTFLGNLCTSTSVSDSIKQKFPPWMVNYCNGLSQEFYLVSFQRDVGKKYIGKRFNQIVEQIFIQHGMLMIGVKVRGRSNDLSDILINPLDYQVQENDEAIIICDDQANADNLFSDGLMRANVLTHLGRQRDPLLFDQEMLDQLNVTKEVTESEILVMETDDFFDQEHFYMWETDMKGKIKNQIIVFGDVDHLTPLLLAIRHYTKQYIFFVCDKSPDDRWKKIRRNFTHVYYLETSFTNIDEIRRTGIEDAFHLILLTWYSSDSAIQDSGILPIVRIVEEHFPGVSYTLELVEESNVKYLNYPPNKEFGNIAFNLWPRHASGNVFFSSTMDFLMAQSYHMESIAYIVGKLINSNLAPNITGNVENNKINVIRLPEDIGNEYCYIDLFKTLLDQNCSIIPLALIRAPKENQNELPLVIINPHPLAPLMSTDLVILLGLPDDGAQPLYKKISATGTPEMSKETETKRLHHHGMNDEIIQLAKKMINEDEFLNTQNQQVLKDLENATHMTEEDRQALLKQNTELRDLLQQYYEMKNKLFV